MHALGRGSHGRTSSLISAVSVADCAHGLFAAVALGAVAAALAAGRPSWHRPVGGLRRAGDVRRQGGGRRLLVVDLSLGPGA